MFKGSMIWLYVKKQCNLSMKNGRCIDDDVRMDMVEEPVPDQMGVID